jgi:phosphonate transport system substrate-binding protein
MADPTPSVPPADAAKAKPSPLAGLAIPLLLILAAGVVFAVFYALNQNVPPVNAAALFDRYAAAAAKASKLADEYTDADGDQIADTPADAKEPAELYFCEIPGPNPDADEKTWAAFLEHMSQATGKPCKYLKRVDGPLPAVDTPPDTTGEETAPPADAGAVKSFSAQLAALSTGKLHVTAFSTGQVRQAVNTAGFRPLVVPADKDGQSSFRVNILVPAASPAKELKDLKGKTLAVSSMSSHSGAKVPLVLLKDQGGLDPRTDVQIKLVGSYWAALGLLADGKVDAVGVAGDLLARELARGEPSDDEKKLGRVKLGEGQYRVIHTSDPYPKLCFGVSHALPQPLVDKIRGGFESFRFDGTEVGKKYAADAVVRFRPVEYKKDWEGVRKVDERLVEILKAK